MGSPVLGRAFGGFACGAAIFAWACLGLAQVPVRGPNPEPAAPPSGASALPPAPPRPGQPEPPPSAPPPPTKAPAKPPAKAEPPPLDPPPSHEPASRPSFLKTRDELPPPKRERAERVSSRRASQEQEPAFEQRPDAQGVTRGLALDASPWVDFSLTNFWLGERASNFLNLGVQVGGYFAQHLRVAVRLVAPLEEPKDDYRDYSYDAFSSGSPSVSLLYGASVGLAISNSKAFVFAPGLLFLRTDVNDYGSSLSLSLPFEWTTARHLRVGFELALGHAFGGSASAACDPLQSGTSPSQCQGGGTASRPGATAVLLQFYMGFSLGHL